MKKIKDLYNRLLSHPGFVRYFFNTGWMFAEKVLRIIAGLFVGAYVARYLGPTNYGILNYAFSLVSLVTAIATLGLDTIVVRELVNVDEGRKNAMLGTSFLLRLAAAITLLLFLVIIVNVTEPDANTRNVVYVIALGSFFEVFSIINYFFQAKVRSKYVVWSQMASLAVISIVRIILVYTESSLVWFAFSYALDFIVLAIGLLFFYVRDYKLLEWRFSRPLVGFIFKDAWPLMLSTLAITIYMKIDQIMIKWMLGGEANGNYSVAVRLCEMWNFIPLAICSSVFPAILNAKLTDEALYMRRLQRLFDFMVLMSVCIAIPMTFLSDFIVNFLFGHSYRDASGILVLYIWSSVFTFLGVANNTWIVSENLLRFRMVVLILSCALNVGLNFLLIRTIGLNGAAVSTLISYAFASYFSFLSTAKTRTIFVSMTRSFNPIRLFTMFRSKADLQF